MNEPTLAEALAEMHRLMPLRLSTVINAAVAEKAKLREALTAAVAQIEHLEELRRMNAGPTPATLTPDILSDARKLL
jgi:hypothetical protein